MSKMTPEQMREQSKKLAARADNETISQSLEGRIAVVLHDALCGYNHTDGCSWFYEIDDETGASWTGKYNAHAKFRAKARTLLKAGGYEKHLLPVDDEFQVQ